MIRPTTQSERLAPPRFLLPAEFDAEAIVGPLKADAARWLVSTILRKLSARAVGECDVEGR